MKQKKRGFSLAELLVAMAIVSIIATMGFTISKKSIEKAYNLYVYTGYTGISDAMADATAHSGENITTIVNPDVNERPELNPDYINYVRDLLNAGGAGNTITARNGIEYELQYIGRHRININGEDLDFRRIGVRMTVPIKKTGAGANTTTLRFAYMPDEPFGLLIPYDEGNCANEYYGCIQDRVDLLPFFISDNNTGRVVNGQYHPRRYMSAKEALCSVYSGKDIYGTNNPNDNIEFQVDDAVANPMIRPGDAVTCNGVALPGAPVEGTVLLGNPRRL